MPTQPRTALLALHIQPPLSQMPGDDAWIERAADSIKAARAAVVPVIYVNIGYRSGYPELRPGSAQRSQLEAHQIMVRNVSDATDPRVAPEDHEAVVHTTRVGAFTGTDLDELLRAQDVGHVVLTGHSTGGVVLSTVIAALERDLQVTVLSDACADSNPLTHRALLAHFAEGAPWSATVMPSAEWTRSLTTATA